MKRVVIADDSALVRRILTDLLQESGRVQVVGAAENGAEAVEMVRDLKPDLLILDCEMPVMNGLEALVRIMKECPLPVLIFSSLSREGSAVTVLALERGAVDVLVKPSASEDGIRQAADDLLEKVDHIAGRDRFARMASPSRSPSCLHAIPGRRIDLVAVGSSTGGVTVATKILAKLPARMAPIVWVQHMPGTFSRSFAERLNTLSPLEVKLAEDGERLRAGVCYIAPGGIQMRVAGAPGGTAVRVGGTERVGGHCPSCTVLFKSVARYYAGNALGVILTGMGNDGTAGLAMMHERGSYVIGQNEESCVVYGMPRAAREAGAVDVELAADEVAAGIVKAGGF